MQWAATRHPSRAWIPWDLWALWLWVTWATPLPLWGAWELWLLPACRQVWGWERRWGCKDLCTTQACMPWTLCRPWMAWVLWDIWAWTVSVGPCRPSTGCHQIVTIVPRPLTGLRTRLTDGATHMLNLRILTFLWSPWRSNSRLTKWTLWVKFINSLWTCFRFTDKTNNAGRIQSAIVYHSMTVLWKFQGPQTDLERAVTGPSTQTQEICLRTDATSDARNVLSVSRKKWSDNLQWRMTWAMTTKTPDHPRTTEICVLPLPTWSHPLMEDTCLNTIREQHPWRNLNRNPFNNPSNHRCTTTLPHLLITTSRH